MSITIHGSVLRFTNTALQNYPIGFDPQPDGTFAVTHIDVGGDVVDISGRITGRVLTADVTNRPCKHHWQLEKK